MNVASLRDEPAESKPCGDAEGGARSPKNDPESSHVPILPGNADRPPRRTAARPL
jgi:hypothetical protein